MEGFELTLTWLRVYVTAKVLVSGVARGKAGDLMANAGVPVFAKSSARSLVKRNVSSI